MEHTIGIEISCSSVITAIINETGSIQEISKKEIVQDCKRDDLIQLIFSMVKKYKQYKYTSIGIVTPGPVKDGVVQLANHLPCLTQCPLVELFQREFQIPCYLENDVNCTALAESYFGIGKQFHSIYYILISTGIGGAYILDHSIVSGTNGFAGEIGNIIIDPLGEQYNHLNMGAVENEASGNALTREGKYFFGDDEIKDAADVFYQAKKKDPIALQICKDFSKDLAILTSIISHVLDPQIFIFGGDCMKYSDLFFPQMEEKYRSLIHDGMQNIQLQKATLEYPALLGASLLSKTKHM